MQKTHRGPGKSTAFPEVTRRDEQDNAENIDFLLRTMGVAESAQSYYRHLFVNEGKTWHQIENMIKKLKMKGKNKSKNSSRK
jgi:hypothetical protein